MLNACELEIDLFCRGLRVPPHVSLDGARGISRTRAGLGSGLEIPIGIAPNIEVSLVVNPDDAALLAPVTPGMVAYELWRRALRVAARPVFARRMRTTGGERRESGKRR